MSDKNKSNIIWNTGNIPFPNGPCNLNDEHPHFYEITFILKKEIDNFLNKFQKENDYKIYQVAIIKILQKLQEQIACNISLNFDHK